MPETDPLVIAPEPVSGDIPAPRPKTRVTDTLSTIRDLWRNKEHRAPVLFTASSIWLSVAQMISGVAIVHYVSPREMGLWASVNLAVTYAFIVLAGVQNGLSRELPYYIGANKQRVAERLAATTLSYTAGGCALAVAGGIGSMAFFSWKGADPKLILAIGAVSLLIAFKFYQNYLFVTFRSKNTFIELARVQMWQGASMLLALPLLFLGYDGLLLRFVLVGGLAVYLMHRVRPMIVAPAWNADSFRLLIKTGVPIFVTDYTTNFAATLGTVALIKFGGLEQVGFYALALSASSAFSIIPQSLAHYIYPRMSHHYGRTNNPGVLWSMAWRTNLILLAAMIPMALAGCLVLPPVVKVLFPKYMGGTYAAQIALFSSVAYGAATGANALASLKAWPHLLFYQFSYAGLLAIGPFLGVHLFSSALSGVAYGNLGANTVGAILALAVTFAATHRKAAAVSPDPGTVDSKGGVDQAAAV